LEHSKSLLQHEGISPLILPYVRGRFGNSETASKTFCIALAAALLLSGVPAYAQLYSWKDPNTGETKLSNIAPRWYNREERISGPRVVKTLNGKVVDDTALSYEDRLMLSGKSKDEVEKLRLQKNLGSQARQDAIRESAKTDAQAADKHSTETARSGAETAGKKGS